MLKAHKIRLRPNKAQAEYFVRACGVARFAWNWALAEWERQYQEGGRPTWQALKTQLNAIKRVEFPWMLEVSKCAPDQAIRNLGKAFSNFLTGRTNRPRFKKKGLHDIFYGGCASADRVRCEGKRIRLPVIGWVRMRQELRFTGRIVSTTVSRTAGRWFVSILVETPETAPEASKNQAAVGVDLGISAMATCSDGTTFANPMPLRKAIKQLKRLCRRVHRKKKGSANRKKAIARLARQHYRIVCVRQDALHKATTTIVKGVGVVILEDLNVQGMTTNHSLARAVADVGMFEFRQQVHYKAIWNGVVVLIAPRFYPSSKTCSQCGAVKANLSLSERTYCCTSCGLELNRDLNAARNLAALACSSTARLAGSNACGDRSPAVAIEGDGVAGQ